MITGHDHLYERLEPGGIKPIHRFLTATEGSKVGYNQEFGAMLVTVDDSCINFTFYSIDNELIDSLTLNRLKAFSG